MTWNKSVFTKIYSWRSGIAGSRCGGWWRMLVVVAKTIQIDNVPNRAPYGWAPMEAMFNNKLQDLYANQTRLKLVKRNGDMHIAGEIVSYDQYNKGVSADGLSSQVQLKMTVNIRFSRDGARPYRANLQRDCCQLVGWQNPSQ